MSRASSRRWSRRALLEPSVACAIGLSAALAGCARFGFELLPVSDGAGVDTPRSPDAGWRPGIDDAGRPANAAPEPPDTTPGVDAGELPNAPLDPGDAASTDAGPPPRCAAFGPFGPPVLVAGLAQPVSIGPAFSDDALTVLYVSNNPYDIFIATRPDRDSPLSNGTALPNVNHAGTDATPFLADGGLTLLFASDRGAQPGFNDLMIASRASLNEDFSAPAPIANVNSPGIELLPHQSSDGLRLYFSSDRVGGNRDIWLSTRPERSAAFSAPSTVAGLNGTSAEFGPTLGSDELEAFFASDRPGGQGSMDVWRAVRNGREAAFGTPENVTVLNSPGYDTDPRLSPDGTELFYSSSRNGSQVLWSARRACVAVAP